MPLVTIDVLKVHSRETLAAIGDGVHQAMMEVLGVPERDRFQILTEHEARGLSFDRSYLDIERSERFVLLRITLASGRSADTKRAFYRRLAELLSERAGLRAEDVAVVLLENEREDWSFGSGQASYLDLPKEAWR
jgi:4-oxalocrotonate tautomerase